MFFKKKKHIERLESELSALQYAHRSSVMALPETIYDKEGNEYVLLTGDLGDFGYVLKNTDSAKL